MILYINKHPRFESYAKGYAEDKNRLRFPVAHHHHVLVDKLMSLVCQGRHVDILELGCGQGNWLEYIYNAAVWAQRCRLPEASDQYLRSRVRCIGMDGAWTAIECAAALFPQIYWIADYHQSFFVKKEELKKEGIIPTVKFNCIVDKGGATFISSEQEAIQFIDNIKSALHPGGIYCYTISETFYDQKARPIIYKEWSTDWISLAKQHFAYSYDLSEGGAYSFVYSNDLPFDGVFSQ